MWPHILEPEMADAGHNLHVDLATCRRLSSIVKKMETIVTEAEEFAALETEFLTACLQRARTRIC